MSLEFKLAFPYEIHIIPTVNGGVIARCGCAELSFSTTNKLLTAMREFFADPEEVEKAYHAARKVSHGPMADQGRLVAGSGRTVESLGPPETERRQAEAPDPGEDQQEQVEESPG